MAKPYNRAQYKVLRNRVSTNWLDTSNSAPLYEQLVDIACADVKTPYANHVYYARQEDTHDRLLSRYVDPMAYISGNADADAKNYYLDNFLSCLVKKYPKWSTSVSPETVAKKSFLQAERQCADTNARLFQSSSINDDDVRQTILYAQRKIGTILPDVPEPHDLDIEFGPGATFTCKGQTGSLQKLTGTLDVTQDALETAVKLLSSAPGWLNYHSIKPCDTDEILSCLTVVPGDRLSFVPKNAKTHRPIGIGPTLNLVLQKGYGSVIRKSLKRNGLHLNRAPEKHVLLAKKASRDGSLATVDLSAASDNISYAIVMNLLPRNWFEALDMCRSPSYMIEDKWYDYHKFSAMGNGYTFELESLIFYALAHAVCRTLSLPTSCVSVFGDDIILPTEGYELLNRTLVYCGFTVNMEKSFCSGPFRESCGGDFFNGISTRGFYVQDDLDLRTLVRLRNYLYRSGYRYYLKGVWKFLQKQLSFLQGFLDGPDDGTDDHIICDYWPLGKSFRFMVSSYKIIKPHLHLQKAMVWFLYEDQHTQPLQYPYMGQMRDIGLMDYDENILRTKVSTRLQQNLPTLDNFKWSRGRTLQQ